MRVCVLKIVRGGAEEDSSRRAKRTQAKRGRTPDRVPEMLGAGGINSGGRCVGGGTGMRYWVQGQGGRGGGLWGGWGGRCAGEQGSARRWPVWTRVASNG